MRNHNHIHTLGTPHYKAHLWFLRKLQIFKCALWSKKSSILMCIYKYVQGVRKICFYSRCVSLNYYKFKTYQIKQSIHTAWWQTFRLSFGVLINLVQGVWNIRALCLGDHRLVNTFAPGLIQAVRTKTAGSHVALYGNFSSGISPHALEYFCHPNNAVLLEHYGVIKTWFHSCGFSVL